MLTIHVDADFADLFAVKAGQAIAGGAQTTVATTSCVADRTDNSRGLRLTASPTRCSPPGPSPGDGGTATGEWSTEIVAQP